MLRNLLSLATAFLIAGCAAEGPRYLPAVASAAANSANGATSGTVHVFWPCPNLKLPRLADNRLALLMDEKQALKIAHCTHAKFTAAAGVHGIRIQDPMIDLAKLFNNHGQEFTVPASGSVYIAIHGHNPITLTEVDPARANAEIAAIDRERANTANN